jgi:hypothetical protein
LISGRLGLTLIVFSERASSELERREKIGGYPRLPIRGDSRIRYK